MKKSKNTKRYDDCKAYVLHTFPWSETSLIARIFSSEYGRTTVIAKGAKQPYSKLRPILSKFQPLILSWTGVSDMKTLVKAEFDDILILPRHSLMAAWYMNDLLLNLLPQEDPHSILFKEYSIALKNLCSSKKISNIILKFEWIFLKEIGYGLDERNSDISNFSSKILNFKLKKRLEQSLSGQKLLTNQVSKDLKKIIINAELV